MKLILALLLLCASLWASVEDGSTIGLFSLENRRLSLFVDLENFPLAGVQLEGDLLSTSQAQAHAQRLVERLQQQLILDPPVWKGSSPSTFMESEPIGERHLLVEGTRVQWVWDLPSAPDTVDFTWKGTSSIDIWWSRPGGACEAKTLQGGESWSIAPHLAPAMPTPPGWMASLPGCLALLVIVGSSFRTKKAWLLAPVMLILPPASESLPQSSKVEEWFAHHFETSYLGEGTMSTSQLHDHLDTFYEGDALEKLMLELSSIHSEKGGQKINRFELQKQNLEPMDGGFHNTVDWTVQGQVLHYGHLHTTSSMMRAKLHIEHTPTQGWQVTSIIPLLAGTQP